jgi:hypothetical protein
MAEDARTGLGLRFPPPSGGHRDGFERDPGETMMEVQSLLLSPAGVPTAAEFFALDREGYASVGRGIQLAVTPRGARATHGAGRLNEETA